MWDTAVQATTEVADAAVTARAPASTCSQGSQCADPDQSVRAQMERLVDCNAALLSERDDLQVRSSCM